MWLFLSVALSVASATTLTVGGSGYPSIQAAIDAASPGDEVVVDPGTWSGGFDLRGKALVIRSRDGAGSTILDAGGGGWVAVFQSGEPAATTLDGFTVQNASGGGLYVAGSSPTFRNLVVRGVGVAGYETPGLYVASGSPSVHGCTFADNVAKWGAHVQMYGGTLTASDSSFTGGVAEYGGAILMFTGASLVGEALSIVGNTATVGYGGGIYADGASVALVGGEVVENLAGSDGGAERYGGGIYAQYSQLSVDGTAVRDNQAPYGGGLAVRGGSASLSGAELSGNYATYAGGLWLDGGGAFTDEASTWDSNTASAHAGAIYGYNTWTATFTGSTFTDNLAAGGYGGAMFGYIGTPVFSGVTFRENVSAYAGGALFFSELYSTATITDSSFDRNTTMYGAGGGIFAQYYSHLVVSGTTLSGNAAYEGGGLYVYYASDASIAGSEVSGNTASLYEGGGMTFHQAAAGYGLLTVTDSAFLDNEAHNEGGAIASSYADTLSISDTRFVRNQAGSSSFGGALLAVAPGTVVVKRSTFAGNLANYGGGVYVQSPTRAATFANNRFQENVARDGGAFCGVGGGRQVWTNNAFVGNSATDRGGVACLVDTSMRFVNNLVAWTSDGAAIHDYSAKTAAAAEYGHNAFFANAEGDASGATPDVLAAAGTLAADPLLVAYTLDGDDENDNLRLLRDSALLDAGDPELLDPDGSRSDIGAYGGPDAPTGDADGDGWDASTDCDDAHPGVHPGATETWYDGVNQDCVGVSDFDQDGDGVDAPEGGGTDCDDTDARRAEACGGPGGDGEDPEGCGCASGGGGGAVGAVVLAALALRRRRGVTLGRQRSEG